MGGDVYQKLGVPTLINAAGTYTLVGGSRMSEATLAAMNQAARSHVVIEELQKAVHQGLARMTRNEAAYVATGAAAAVYLALGAAAALKTPDPLVWLSPEELADREVVVLAAHRNPYDWVIRQLGLRVREVGYPNNLRPPCLRELRAAFNAGTVAVYYVGGEQVTWVPPGAPPLAEVVALAREFGVPVVVDAAAQLPPVENLWNFTAQGAAAVVFSGGKSLCGPQASGLLLGSRELVGVVEQIAFPHYGLGRMLKVGREELVGLYAAVEQFLALDQAAELARQEGMVVALQKALGSSRLFTVERRYPNEAGQPCPRALVLSRHPDRLSAETLGQLLMSGQPRIFTKNEGWPGAFINPMTINEAELELIIRRFQEIEAQVNP